MAQGDEVRSISSEDMGIGSYDGCEPRMARLEDPPSLLVCFPPLSSGQRHVVRFRQDVTNGPTRVGILPCRYSTTLAVVRLSFPQDEVRNPRVFEGTPSYRRVAGSPLVNQIRRPLALSATFAQHSFSNLQLGDEYGIAWNWRDAGVQ